MPYVTEFVQRANLDLSCPAKSTYLVKMDGKFYDIRVLPNEMHIPGDFDINGVTSEIKLPRILTVDGNFSAVKANVIEWPQQLRVGQTFDLTGTRLASPLPDDVEIGENAGLTLLNITTLPNR
jgi:hypothetical protein